MLDTFYVWLTSLDYYCLKQYLIFFIRFLYEYSQHNHKDEYANIFVIKYEKHLSYKKFNKIPNFLLRRDSNPRPPVTAGRHNL